MTILNLDARLSRQRLITNARRKFYYDKLGAESLTDEHIEALFSMIHELRERARNAEGKLNHIKQSLIERR